MATNPIQALRLRALFEGSNIGENRVTPPVFGADAPPVPQDTTEMNAPQYDELFPTGDINQVRMQNVMQPPAQAQEREKSLMDIINEHYTPETQDTERFRNLIDSFPERGEPSFGDKLAAAGAYLGNLQRHIQGGPEAAEKVKYAQYNRDLEDWKAQTTPTNQLAQLERTANANERQFAGQIGTAELGQRKLEEAQRVANLKNEIEQSKIKLKQFALENGPNWEYDYKGPVVMASNKVTGQTISTGVPTGHVDDLTKITLTNVAAQKRAETVADAMAARTQTTTEAGGWIPVEIPDPNDPTKKIAARMNTRTGETAIVKFEGQTSSATKLGAPLVQPPAANLAAIRGMTKEVLDLLDNEVLDSTGKEPKLNSKIEAGLGWSQWDPRQFLPESEQRAANRTFGRLKDMLTLELIGEMKQQSKTGATGFGQLTGRELDVLESAASKLDPALDNKTLIAELKRIREKLQKVMLPPDGLNPTTVTTPGSVTPENRGVGGGPVTLPPKYQQNPDTGEMRVSYDGGKTWSKFVKK